MSLPSLNKVITYLLTYLLTYCYEDVIIAAVLAAAAEVSISTGTFRVAIAI